VDAAPLGKEAGMRYLLRKFVAAAWGVLTCLAIICTSPATASSIVYDVNLQVSEPPPPGFASFITVFCAPSVANFQSST
jgi:hypothetical protein